MNESRGSTGERHGEKLVSVEKEARRMLSMESKRDSAQKETHNRLLLHRERRLKNVGKSFLKGKTLGGRSPSGKRCQRPWKNYISGICSDPLCDLLAPSRMSTSQNTFGMQIRRKVRLHSGVLKFLYSRSVISKEKLCVLACHS